MASGRNPDVAVVFKGTPKDDRARRPPAWSGRSSRPVGKRDYATKRDEYLTFGVVEYWIVDPSDTPCDRADSPKATGRRVVDGTELSK